MDKVSEQAVEFCKEIELLARLHQRHLVALKGFYIEKHESFLMYEYMANGSLKDHLHTPSVPLLSWQKRIQIAIDVANALTICNYHALRVPSYGGKICFRPLEHLPVIEYYRTAFAFGDHPDVDMSEIPDKVHWLVE